MDKKVMNLGKVQGLQMEFSPTLPGDRQGAEALAKSKAVAEMDPALKKELRQDEDLNKKALLEREKENFTNIFALKCYNGWLKFYNNSAVIVSVWLDGKLGSLRTSTGRVSDRI